MTYQEEKMQILNILAEKISTIESEYYSDAGRKLAIDNAKLVAGYDLDELVKKMVIGEDLSQVDEKYEQEYFLVETINRRLASQRQVINKGEK